MVIQKLAHSLVLVGSVVVIAACTTPWGRRVASGDSSRVTVPDSPPDSVPRAIWNEIHAPSNIEHSAPEWSAPFPRNVVLVMFRERASRSAKQRAIDAIGGTVIGGAALGRGGYYYVRIEDDGTSRPLFRAISTLRSLSQVELATPELPEDGPIGTRRARP